MAWQKSCQMQRLWPGEGWPLSKPCTRLPRRSRYTASLLICITCLYSEASAVKDDPSSLSLRPGACCDDPVRDLFALVNAEHPIKLFLW